MKGRWAAGIVPRNFSWVVTDHLAVAERPGGSAPAHRRVRRREEILWLRAQGFTKVVSLLPSTHNLHAYEELELGYEHVPMGLHDDPTKGLADLYPALLQWLYGGERILVHQDELSERLAGVLAGFLWWSGIVPEPPLAISAIEQLLRRQLGSIGRTIVTLAVEVPPQSEDDRGRPERAAAAKLVVVRLAELERARNADAQNGADVSPLRSEPVSERETQEPPEPNERRPSRRQDRSRSDEKGRAAVGKRALASAPSTKSKAADRESAVPSAGATKAATKRTAAASKASSASAKTARSAPSGLRAAARSSGRATTKGNNPPTSLLSKSKKSAEGKAIAKRAAATATPKPAPARTSSSRRGRNDAT